jgi:hypothetical protein
MRKPNLDELWLLPYSEGNQSCLESDLAALMSKSCTLLGMKF